MLEEQIWICELAFLEDKFLPFYGLLAAFMAFLLKPMTFPE